MGSSGIKGLIKVMSSLYFATFGVFPVKTVILANVRPFRDKLIYFGCLFNHCDTAAAATVSRN